MRNWQWISRWRITRGGLLAYLLALGPPVLAQQNVSENDLRSAYCVGALYQQVQRFSSSAAAWRCSTSYTPEECRDSLDRTMRALKVSNDKLIVFTTTLNQRLNGANIDDAALAEARERGKADEQACHEELKAVACATVSRCTQ